MKGVYTLLAIYFAVSVCYSLVSFLPIPAASQTAQLYAIKYAHLDAILVAGARFLLHNDNKRKVVLNISGGLLSARLGFLVLNVVAVITERSNEGFIVVADSCIYVSVAFLIACLIFELLDLDFKKTESSKQSEKEKNIEPRSLEESQPIISQNKS
jgi:hypothetical protein